MRHQKRVAAIHDLSGVGKCSLTVALPILAAAGIECCPIPTAVLSTHTGGFKNFTFCDLTSQILPIANHWAAEKFEFNAVYTGYLGSVLQVETLQQAVQKIGKNAMLIVDPVMGDNGELYHSFTPEFPLKMRDLCKMADVITPNITEACFLLGVPFLPPPHTESYIETLVHGLGKLCSGQVVLTGVEFKKNSLGAVLYSAKTKQLFHYAGEKLQGSYPGTGDVFASTLTAGLVSGMSAERAVKFAVDFTGRALKTTVQKYPDLWYGVAFEDELDYFIKQVQRYGTASKE